MGAAWLLETVQEFSRCSENCSSEVRTCQGLGVTRRSEDQVAAIAIKAFVFSKCETLFHAQGQVKICCYNVYLWEIFMEQESRFGLYLGRFGNF